MSIAISAAKTFTPDACWPLALECLGVKTIPTNPEEGTKLLSSLLKLKESSAIHDLAREVTQKIVNDNIFLDFDKCYWLVIAFFRALQKMED
jgi:hypothetical protein